MDAISRVVLAAVVCTPYVPTGTTIGTVTDLSVPGYIPRLGTYIRAVTLGDGIPVHNVFKDRDFNE